MKVLVSDNLGEDGIRMFQDAPGIEVDVKTGLEPDALKAIIAEYDALVIRSATKVTEDLLQAATRLKVVGRAGIGLDNVDIPAATQRGGRCDEYAHGQRGDDGRTRHCHDAGPDPQHPHGYRLPAGRSLGEEKTSGPGRFSTRCWVSSDMEKLARSWRTVPAD